MNNFKLLFRLLLNIIWISKNFTALYQYFFPKSIPIIINNFNQLFYLKRLIVQLQELGFYNIVIIDNKSTYPELLEYYETVKSSVKVVRLDENLGHLSLFKLENLYKKYCKGFYVLTDADINLNENFDLSNFKFMVRLLVLYCHIVTKVGTALDINSIPSYYSLKQNVLSWESRFWTHKIKHTQNCFWALIDTTFAIYKPNYLYNKTNFYEAIRVAGECTATHGGWYVDNTNLTAEQLYYFLGSNKSNSWNPLIDENVP